MINHCCGQGFQIAIFGPEFLVLSVSWLGLILKTQPLPRSVLTNSRFESNIHTQNCVCMTKESTTILKLLGPDPWLLINSENKIKRVYRQRPWFHTSKHVKQTSPTLMRQSMTKEQTQHAKLSQMSTCAMFVWLLSNWAHCDDQQK